MQPGQWYKTTFRDGTELYFIGDSFLKNGRLQGVVIEVDPAHPRRTPRGKRQSVHPRLDASLWRAVQAPPAAVVAAAASKSGDRRRRHGNAKARGTRSAEAAVRAMQLYIGSQGYCTVRDQQRLYNRVRKAAERVAREQKVTLSDSWAIISSEARGRGPIRPVLGKDL
jgi:hypothetical protein